MLGLPNLHPMLVHFSVALLSVATFLFVAIECLKDGKIPRQMLIVARWNLWMGSLISVLTMVTGLNAFATVSHTALSHQAMLVHKTWAQTIAWLFLALAFWQNFTYHHKPMRILFLLGLITSWFVLLIAAHHGGKLVYTYGVGVKTPETSTAISVSDQVDQSKPKTSKSDIEAAPNNHDHDHDH